MTSASDQLQTLGELFCKNQEVKKACSLGVVIDCTAAYKIDDNKDFVRRIKLIDVTLNPEIPIQGTSHCTVTFFGKTPEELPAPTRIGQILYLRRYDFNVWNNQFQARKTAASNISSWILFSGDSKQNGFAEIQTSREDISLLSEKFTHLLSPLNELRLFAKDFFSNNPIVGPVQAGKDLDLVLRVKESLNNEYILTNGERDFEIELNRFIKIGTVVKVRSIDRIEDNKRLIKNNYTYVLELENWMEKFNSLSYSSQPTVTLAKAGKEYLTLQDIRKIPPQSGNRVVVHSKVEVIDIQPQEFKDCIKNYNLSNNTFSNTQDSSTKTVYNLRFLLRDTSINTSQLLDCYLFSWDGKGSDFLKNVNINELDKSSLKAESDLFNEKINELLENTNPENPVEVDIEVNWKGNTAQYRIVGI